MLDQAIKEQNEAKLHNISSHITKPAFFKHHTIRLIFRQNIICTRLNFLFSISCHGTWDKVKSAIGWSKNKPMSKLGQRIATNHQQWDGNWQIYSNTCFCGDTYKFHPVLINKQRDILTMHAQISWAHVAFEPEQVKFHRLGVSSRLWCFHCQSTD